MIDLFNPDKEALIAKWKHVIDIIGPHNKWDTHLELAWICEAASQVRGYCSYLEVGSFMGASMKAVMLANSAIEGVCFDTWDDPGSQEAFLTLLHQEIASQRVRFIKCTSEEGFQKIGMRYKFDFAFIDASHLYDGVKNDIMDALQVMKPGAIIAGHDYRPDLPEDGVTRSVRELLPGYKNVVDSIWSYKCP